MNDTIRKIYSEIANSENGITVNFIHRRTGIAERTIYYHLKFLKQQKRVFKDTLTGLYRVTRLPLRGCKTRKCHGLMIHFTKYVGRTVLGDFIEYAKERHPDFLIQRELSIHPNTHSTLDFKTTNSPLSIKDLETLEQITYSYLGDINWRYSRFTYNIDNALCTLEPKAVTIKESHRLLRIYNHPYNRVPYLRFEVEKTKISHEEALKLLLYQADVDYLLDVILHKDRLIDALIRQLYKERIDFQYKARKKSNDRS